MEGYINRYARWLFLFSTTWIFKVQALEKCNFDAVNVFVCYDNLTFEGFCCNQQEDGYFSRCCYYPLFPPDVPTSNINWYCAVAFAVVCLLVYAIVRRRIKLRRIAETQGQPTSEAEARLETAQCDDLPPTYHEVTGGERHNTQHTEATKPADATRRDGKPPPYDWIAGEGRFSAQGELLSETSSNQHSMPASSETRNVYR